MRRALVGVVLVAACGSSSSSQKFGKVPNDGIDAIKQWCGGGKLEMETTLPTTSSKSARENPSLLVFDCLNTGATDPERGWIAIDSKTNDLLEFVVTVHPTSALLDRVLVPALTEEQKTRLAEARTSMATGKDSSWRSGNVVIAVARNQGEETWQVFARYKN